MEDADTELPRILAVRRFTAAGTNVLSTAIRSSAMSAVPSGGRQLDLAELRSFGMSVNSSTAWPPIVT